MNGARGRLSAVSALLLALAVPAAAEISAGRMHLQERVSLHLKESDLRDVLLTIQRITGWNLVVGPGVSGKVTLDVEDTTLATVLDLLAKQNRLAFEDDGSILLVETIAEATGRAAMARGDDEPPPPRDFVRDPVEPGRSGGAPRSAAQVRYEVREGSVVVAAGSFPLDGTPREIGWTRAIAPSRGDKGGRLRIAWLPREAGSDRMVAVLDRVDAPSGSARLARIDLDGPEASGTATFAATRGRDPLIVRLDRVGSDPFLPPATAEGRVVGRLRDAIVSGGPPMTIDVEIYRQHDGREEILASPRVTTEELNVASIVSGTTGAKSPREVRRISIDLCAAWNGDLADIAFRLRFEFGDGPGELDLVRNLAETGAWHIVKERIGREPDAPRFRFRVLPRKG